MSPYMPKITGQEDYVYVWTLGVEGVGDGSDKLVTIGANPKTPEYGKVVHQVSVGGRHEAHHGGFTDDRRHLWVGGLDDQQDLRLRRRHRSGAPEAREDHRRLRRQDSGGVVGPHTFYALPGRMLITALSNAKDGGGKTALVEYSNDGEFVAHDLDAPESGRVRLRRARRAATEPHADLVVHRQEELHAAARRAA